MPSHILNALFLPRTRFRDGIYPHIDTGAPAPFAPNWKTLLPTSFKRVRFLSNLREGVNFRGHEESNTSRQ